MTFHWARIAWTISSTGAATSSSARFSSPVASSTAALSASTRAVIGRFAPLVVGLFSFLLQPGLNFNHGLGRGAKIATYRDLGSFQLLLSLQDDQALKLLSGK